MDQRVVFLSFDFSPDGAGSWIKLDEEDNYMKLETDLGWQRQDPNSQ